jgi:hypothetical protein
MTSIAETRVLPETLVDSHRRLAARLAATPEAPSGPRGA